MNKAHVKSGPNAVYLYDNLPEVLFGYLGAAISVLAVISLPSQVKLAEWKMFEAYKDNAWLQWLDNLTILHPHTVFWAFAKDAEAKRANRIVDGEVFMFCCRGRAGR